MSAETTLTQLLPLDLGGKHAGDLAVDGRQIDTAAKTIDVLLDSVFPDTSSILLMEWERVLGLVPAVDDILQARRDRAVMKLRDRGSLSIPYFIALAQANSPGIEIVEPLPSMAGWLCADDELMSADVVWQWGVKFHGGRIYEFRADESSVDEPLLWWENKLVTEQIISRLKPAHTFVYFDYSEE